MMNGRTRLVTRAVSLALCSGTAFAQEAQNAGELAEVEHAELAVLETYLPKQLDDAELERIVREAVATSGATGMQQMGVAMKAANAAVAGRAEGGRVAAVVRQVLAG